MPADIALIALLHVIVFVYWLGGDIGAFYASFIVTDAKQPIEARAAALRVMRAVDMAPRFCLILAFPTGLTLAASKGWIAVPPAILAALWLVAIAWIALVWLSHHRSAPASSPLRRIDMAARWIAVAGLAAMFAWGIAARPALPLFVLGKLAIVAMTFLCGLAIRKAGAPFGPAYERMLRDGPNAESDAIMRRTMARTRPLVLVIWALLLCAAFLGIAKPV